MQISNAEWQVMRIIWTQGQTTSKEITQLLQEQWHWTASTVKTLLKRLVEKQYVTTEKNGKHFLYSAKVTEDESVQALSREVSEKICTKKMPHVIMELIAGSDLSAQDISQLQALLQNKQPVAAVTCHCLPGKQ